MTLVSLALDSKGGATETEPLPITATPRTGNGPFWVHLNFTDPRDINWLEEQSGLAPLIIDALIASETRPRSSTIDDGLLIALRGVNLSAGAMPEDMVSIRLWIDQNHIISTRKRDLLSVADIREQLENGEGPASSAEFLLRLLSRLVEHMSETISDQEEAVAELEEQILTEGDPKIKRHLSVIRRRTITLRRYLAPQREALSRIIAEKISWIDDDCRLELREVSDQLTRHIENLDALRDRAAVAHEEIISRLSDQLNSRMYILSVVAAIFLPLGFLTGLLGVNLGGIPGSENPEAFSLFLISLTLLLGFLIWLFKTRRWL